MFIYNMYFKKRAKKKAGFPGFRLDYFNSRTHAAIVAAWARFLITLSDVMSIGMVRISQGFPVHYGPAPEGYFFIACSFYF